MTWIPLAALAAMLSLAGGGILLTVWSRRRFRHRSGVFACRLREAGPPEDDEWPRAKRYAYWVHDVLIVHRGAALRRYEALPVATVVTPIQGRTTKTLGERTMWLRLHLDDGRLVDLAAGKQDVSPATGPFLTAALR